METPSIDDRVIHECWKSKVPLRLSLKNCGVPECPLPFYTELPRYAYLPNLFHDALQFFARSAVDQTSYTVVFEFEGLSLPWHVPVGVLYDLIADGQLPWKLQVVFVTSPPPELLPWENDPDGNLTSLRKQFFSSLKESAYILNGSDGSNLITQLSREVKENLWQSAKDANTETYMNILNEAKMPSIVDQSDVVPVRILLQKGRQVLCWKDDILYLSRPVDAESTVLMALQDFFPSIAWEVEGDGGLKSFGSVEDIDAEQTQAFHKRPIISVCSIEPRIDDITIAWLYRNMHAPDNFLYIVIKPKERLNTKKQQTMTQPPEAAAVTHE